MVLLSSAATRRIGLSSAAIVGTDRLRFAPDGAGHRYTLTPPIAFDRAGGGTAGVGIGFTKNGGVPEGYRKRVESAVSRRGRLGPLHYDFVTGNSNEDVHSKAQDRCCNDRHN